MTNSAINRITINMAKRRKIAFKIRENDQILNRSVTSLEICAVTEGEPWSEYHALYEIRIDGFFLMGGCFGTSHWPHWIESELHLRALLDSMAYVISLNRS